ncbi:methyltransferase domain-containing protein [Dermacoccus sp. 147Ba]|uniref:methyltransferase domain-containing protein n=1 Tax=Dermacoccus sp. 147Ba TaxID=2510111 RepID=UPI00101D2711|nr:methyltransferase domain-containing protein [Dermacoccus sp. 147Ba]RYI23799.1 methyltransferase domain-containing protein [Dermacoccus sp. 147Ba]
MECVYFDRHRCRSCTLLETPYAEQLRNKQARVAETLATRVADGVWRPARASAETRFRSKAKLAVGGTLQAPTLGITDADGTGVDLRECGIQDEAIWDVVPDLAGFVTYAGLRPYDVTRREGALKFVLVTANTDGELMVRFVLRSEDDVPRLREALPALLERLPQVRAVSANIHPEHKAVVEGDLEIPLTPEQTLRLPVGDVTLHLRHRSFLQTNTDVAGDLYRQAAAWADAVHARNVLDLYCGVGGFALHLAGEHRRVHGVEIEPTAVESARLAASERSTAGDVTFEVGDASVLDVPAEDSADLVVVNPPRRGIGEHLARTLDGSGAHTVIYSSCNPTTLAADLEHLASFDVTAARLFDMFPHTHHAEVAVLLRRRL